MDHYVSDDEQVEAIKKWLKDNGSALIGGVVLGLGAIFGWQYWGDYRTAQGEQASEQFDVVVRAVESGNVAEVQRAGEALIAEHASSPYAALAALTLAATRVEAGELEGALVRLQWVVDNGGDSYAPLARLRQARVLIDLGRHDEAEARLASVPGGHYGAELEELRGDLEYARGDHQAARRAYEAALALQGGGSEIVRLKLDGLKPAEQVGG